VAVDYKGRAKVVIVDVDTDKALADSQGAMTVPHLALYHGGEKVSDLPGVASPDRIYGMLANVLD
jgi:thioredoxin-like negative regulator of GroEL